MNISELTKHENNMGTIQMVLESCSIGSISRIYSLPNSWRARHMHPVDFHYCEIIEGQIIYLSREIEKNIKPVREILNKGDIFYTPPQFQHEMIFPCYTIFNCYSKLPRNQLNYEKETIRFNYSLQDVYNSWKD